MDTAAVWLPKFFKTLLILDRFGLQKLDSLICWMNVGFTISIIWILKSTIVLLSQFPYLWEIPLFVSHYRMARLSIVNSTQFLNSVDGPVSSRMWKWLGWGNSSLESSFQLEVRRRADIESMGAVVTFILYVVTDPCLDFGNIWTNSRNTGKG